MRVIEVNAFWALLAVKEVRLWQHHGGSFEGSPPLVERAGVNFSSLVSSCVSLLWLIVLHRAQLIGGQQVFASLTTPTP